MYFDKGWVEKEHLRGLKNLQVKKLNVNIRGGFVYLEERVHSEEYQDHLET